MYVINVNIVKGNGTLCGFLHVVISTFCMYYTHMSASLPLCNVINIHIVRKWYSVWISTCIDIHTEAVAI